MRVFIAAFCLFSILITTLVSIPTLHAQENMQPSEAEIVEAARAPLAARECPAPWGFPPVAEGQWVTAYYEERPTGGRRCQSEMRFCNNGFLSGSYRYQRCNEDFSCNEYPFGTIPHLGSVIAFRNSMESGGRRCEQEVRYCQYGRLSGSFMNRHCSQFP